MPDQHLRIRVPPSLRHHRTITAPSPHHHYTRYNLDSALLHELADEGDGMYTFIPDSSFVGTAFVNCTSNVLATIASNATLSVETLNGATVVEDSVMGYR